MSKGGMMARKAEMGHTIFVDGDWNDVPNEFQILFDVCDVHDCDTKTNRVERNIYTGLWFVDVTPNGQSTQVLYITHCPFCGVKL